METYRKWVMEVLNVPDVADTLAGAGVSKALDTSMSVVRIHADLELRTPAGA